MPPSRRYGSKYNYSIKQIKRKCRKRRNKTARQVPDIALHKAPNSLDISSRAPVTSPPKLEPFHVLTFGDSITTGYYRNGRAHHPYSIQLERLLNERYSADVGDNVKNPVTVCESGQPQPKRLVTVIEAGEDGDFTSSMCTRLTAKLELFPVKFRYACLLGGLNDMEPDDPNLAVSIVANLKAMSDTLLQATCEAVFVATVPVCAFDAQIQWYKEAKDSVNSLLRCFARDTPNVFLVDLNSRLNYLALDDDHRKLLWDDSLHFTPTGYDILADQFFRVMDVVLP